MTALRETLSSIYYNLSLRSKLITSYLVLIILPVLLLGIFINIHVRQAATEQTGKAYMEALKQAEKNISYSLEIGTNIADIAQKNDDVQRILRTIHERLLTGEEEIDFFSILFKNVTSFESSRNVVKVSYFTKGGPSFVSASPNILNVDRLVQEPALQPLLAGEMKQMWLFSGELKNIPLSRNDELVLLREIRNLTSISSAMGYIMIEMDAGFVWNILKDINLPRGADIVVWDREKPVRSFDLSQDSAAAVKNFMDAASGQEGILHYKKGSGSHYAVTSNIRELNWNVTLLLTEEHMGMNSRSLLSSIFLMAALISVLAVTTAVFISGTITKRLKRLVRLIRQAEKGNFEIDENVKGNDEYAHLQRNFNRMSMTIKELIEEVYQARLSRQEAEMRLLYAQINPHFLYNTLDIIHWSALRMEAKDIADITESLAKFLRLSLNGGKEAILLSEELEEVTRYMHIINYRYKGAIRFVTDIQEGIGDTGIIKMILQPLVENAVIHGIRPKKEKSGTIRIRAYTEGEYLCAAVIDDGVGMGAGRLAGVLEKDSRGYGVKNVHQRIRVHYGEDCGLQYFSRPGIGCCVVARLRTE